MAALFATAVRAVDPAALVALRLRRDGQRLSVTGTGAQWSGPTLIAGAGKAAARMAQAAAATLGAELAGGVIVSPHGSGAGIAGITCRESGHPLPDTDGESATRALIDALAAQPRAAVLALISGGASSLLVQPTAPVTLRDKIATTAALLACGADIREFNTVRKHLSLVKGGGLVRLARGRPLVALLLSDVIGDDPATIGSGPTAADPTTFADALGILRRYRILQSLPASVRTVLQAGERGELPETLKPDSAELDGVTNVVIGSNRIALAAAAAAARDAGYQTLTAAAPLSGDTTASARTYADWVRRESQARKGPLCLLAGGETTVRLGASPGQGGRNQEFALVCAAAIAGQDLAVLSAGSDGIDGPTDAAGAFADGTTLARARHCGLDAAAALAAHDSYRFFNALGDLFQPGATGTNVMDIKIALAG